MITGRMLKVINYLNNVKNTTYKNLASDLQIKERLIRYDIEKINDYLNSKGLPTIQKESKGRLVYPDVLTLNDFELTEEFIYNQEERIALILLLLLLDSKRMKLNQLSRELQISRSTIKNDLDLLELQLEKKHINIEYHQEFYLEGMERNIFNLTSDEFQKYVDIIVGNKKILNAFEEKVIEIIKDSFHNASLEKVVNWIDELLDSMHCLLTDQLYRWYVANVLILVNYIINERPHPLEQTEIDAVEFTIFEEPIKELETIINKKISLKQSRVLVKLMSYTNKYGLYGQSIDLVEIEKITKQLISLMSEKTDLPFEKDEILFQGLINHMTALISRVNQEIVLKDNVTSILSNNDIKIFEIVLAVTKEIGVLNKINNDTEITYLAIHFIASIKRIKENQYKRILLVCGFGYGTSTMLKETLVNEFQITIVDIIPTYKISSYQNWNEIDYVITTTPIELLNDIKVICVNPILSNQDFNRLRNMGILRKNFLTQYQSINRNLDFLTDDQRLKVLEVIQKEIGNFQEPEKNKIEKLTDLLKYEDILVINEKLDWSKSVYRSSKSLIEKGYINEDYIDEIFENIKNLGFYSVTDEGFALLHGKGNDAIKSTCMSLLINQQPIKFNDKTINLVFVLASKDKKEHIPAIITWVRMITNTDVISQLSKCQSNDEAYDIIKECESKVV